jgi:carbon storage regulator
MLILTRNIGQAIIIGEGDDKAEVRILNIIGDKVKLGITASPQIPVDREEIYNKKQQEKEKEAKEIGDNLILEKALEAKQIIDRCEKEKKDEQK